MTKSSDSVTASQVFAANLLAEFAAAGVTDIFMAPGARSQALTIAAGQLAEAGIARLFVRLDERSLAFTALGAALADKKPKLVITTSGTSVANLHPAVLEAHHSGVPLILLTADRPHEARGVGVSQTTNQVGIFADAIRGCFDVEAPRHNDDPDNLATMARDLATQALEFCYGTAQDLPADAARPGPVQLNLAFTEPLSSSEPNAVDVYRAAEVRVAVERATFGAMGLDRSGEITAVMPPPDIKLDLSLPTVIIAGADSPLDVCVIAPGVPLLAEPSSGVRFGEEAILGYRAIIDQRPELIQQIKQVLVFGKPTLSRQALSLLRLTGVRVLVWPSQHGRFDPAHNAEVIDEPTMVGREADPAWLAAWKQADADLRPMLDPQPADALDRPNLVDVLWKAAEVVEGQSFNWLVLGASRMIREAETWAGAQYVNVLSNRGLAGIDGTIATAEGVALVSHKNQEAPETVRALMGDLNFFHDASSLVVDPLDGELNLQVYVVNDHGGTIFKGLEPSKLVDAETFTRLFETPQTASISGLAAAYGWNYKKLNTVGELQSVLHLSGRWVFEIELV